MKRAYDEHQEARSGRVGQKTAGIAPGRARLVEISWRQSALFNVNGRLYAIDNVCTSSRRPSAERDGWRLVPGTALSSMSPAEPGCARPHCETRTKSGSRRAYRHPILNPYHDFARSKGQDQANGCKLQ